MNTKNRLQNQKNQELGVNHNWLLDVKKVREVCGSSGDNKPEHTADQGKQIKSPLKYKDMEINK